MPGPRPIRPWFALIAVALLLLLSPVGVGAQQTDCQQGCKDFLAQEGLAGPEDMNQCVQNCRKLQELGIEGFSIKCAYTLPKVCGAQLGWDLLRHCFKPCIEFKKTDCCDCLAKYGFCGKHSQCREWVCKCLMKDSTSCEDIFHDACGR